ncbi:hypothetical protein N7522_005295 [Penicillium canescens]|nr:hypothetical protein N7522_005295 [Penicillium canescens]
MALLSQHLYLPAIAPFSSAYFPYSPSFPSPSTKTTSLPVAYSLLFYVLLWSVNSARSAMGAQSQKKQPPTRTKKPESDSSEDNIIAAISSDLERGDAIYKTDLTELEDVSSPRKRLRSDDNLALEPEVSFDARELYIDPLDKGRVDLSKIPEDFDKALGTIERRERIKSRWKSARPRRRYARRRTIICIVSYASVSSSSEARTKNLRCYYQKLTKIVIKDKDSLEIRREFSLDTQPRKKTPVYIEDIGPFNKTILSI